MWKSMCFNLGPLPLVLSLDITEKNMSLLWFFYQALMHMKKISLSLLFSKLSSTSLSISTYERCSRHLITCLWVTMTFAGHGHNSMCPCPSCGTQIWTQYSRWGLSRKEKRVRNISLLATSLLMQPRRLLIFVETRACSWILVNIQSARSSISFNVKLLFNWYVTHHEFVHGIISAKMKVFLFSFVEFCEIPVYTVVHLDEVPLNCILPTWCIDNFSDVCFISKCGDVTLADWQVSTKVLYNSPSSAGQGRKIWHKAHGLR